MIAKPSMQEEYGTFSWLRWISNSTLENLVRAQHNAGRDITGQLRTTPVEAIVTEANPRLIKTQAIQLSTIAMEKSLRTAVTNQRPSEYGNAPKSLAGVKNHVMPGEKSLVMLNPPRYPNLSPNGLMPVLMPLS